jgi:pyrroloquinoline quinone biosynthesis protein B
MRVTVLGSGAGGGLPQWNCGCTNCVLVRAGDPRIQARTQDSIVVTRPLPATGAAHSLHDSEPPGGAWLVNASPDILQQIQAAPVLHPRALRHSPIDIVLLTNGDMDHILGLFSLRESYSFTVVCTQRVWDGLQRNSMMKTLDRFPGHVSHRPLVLGHATELAPGYRVTAWPLSGKLPVHLEGAMPDSPEDNVALSFQETGGGSLLYASACREPQELVKLGLGVDVALVDGTFFTETELIDQSLGKSPARSMAHAPISGDAGSMTIFATWSAKRTIYTHLNNTNPVLIRDSSEALQVQQAGLEIAYDGMVIDV